MASKAPSRELAPQCFLCRRAGKGSGECQVILYPQALWAEKECWAYTLEADWERKAIKATANYAGGSPSQYTPGRS